MPRQARATRSEAADVVHSPVAQPVQALDARLLPTPPPARPHRDDVMLREPWRGELRDQKRLDDRIDAVVVHSEHGRGAWSTGEPGVDPAEGDGHPHARQWTPQGCPVCPWPQPKTHRHVTPCSRPHPPVQGPRRAARGVGGCDDAELWVVGLPKSIPRRLNPRRTAERPRPSRASSDPEDDAPFRRERATLSCCPTARSTSRRAVHGAGVRDAPRPEDVGGFRRSRALPRPCLPAIPRRSQPR